MLGVFAEFETNLRKERQLEGIAKAKGGRCLQGALAKIDTVKVHGLRAKAAVPRRSPKRWASAGRASTGCWKPGSNYEVRNMVAADGVDAY
jgi:hypothetical protein